MSKVTRRKFMRTTAAAVGSVSLFGILTRRGDAAEFVYRYANNNVAAPPMNVRLREAVDKIKEESNGRLEVQVFPNSQLGGATDIFSHCATRGVHLLYL